MVCGIDNIEYQGVRPFHTTGGDYNEARLKKLQRYKPLNIRVATARGAKCMNYSPVNVARIPIWTPKKGQRSTKALYRFHTS